MNVNELRFLQRVKELFTGEVDGERMICIVKEYIKYEDDLQHFTMKALVEEGFFHEASQVTSIPIYYTPDLTFVERHQKRLTEWHDPKKVVASCSHTLDQAMGDAREYVDGNWVDNGIGPYEYQGCPGFHTQADYEYEVKDGPIEWWEASKTILTKEELKELMEVDGTFSVTVSGAASVELAVHDVEMTLVEVTEVKYSGKVNDKWVTTHTENLYIYNFSGIVREAA